MGGDSAFPEASGGGARFRRFAFVVAVAIAATLPALAIRLSGAYPPPVVSRAIFGLSIVGAGFLLPWGAEAAEGTSPRALHSPGSR